MKKEDILKTIALELTGIAVGLLADTVIRKVKKKLSKEDLDESLVADLTVGELREILKEGAA